MTQEELWKHFTAKNLALEGDGECTMTKANMKKFFMASFQGGYNHGYVQGKAMADAAKIAKPQSPFDGLFDDMFGGQFGKKKP